MIPSSLAPVGGGSVTITMGIFSVVSGIWDNLFLYSVGETVDIWLSRLVDISDGSDVYSGVVGSKVVTYCIQERFFRKDFNQLTEKL